MYLCLCVYTVLFLLQVEVFHHTAYVHVGDEAVVALILLPAGKLYPMRRLTRKCKAAFHQHDNANTPKFKDKRS